MHRRLGILGGMTPESTVTYYQHIVRRYQQRFGTHGYPEIVIYSMSFRTIEEWMEADQWDRLAEPLGQALAAPPPRPIAEHLVPQTNAGERRSALRVR